MVDVAAPSTTTSRVQPAARPVCGADPHPAAASATDIPPAASAADRTVPCVLMRAGTSRGPFFLRGWLPADETARILGLNAAEFYNFDLDRLRPIADRIGPTPVELGQTDPSVLTKWDGVKAAGRPWLSNVEAVPVPVG